MTHQRQATAGERRVVRIECVGHRGYGIAHADGKPLHVPLTLPGETVAVAAGGDGRATLVEVIEASPDRVAPFCPRFGACGGCAVQHWREDAYRAWKRGLLAEALRRRGIETAVGELIDAHGSGRRRATLHARAVGGSFVAGFKARRGSDIVDIGHCPVLAPALAQSPRIARALARILEGRPIDLTLTASDTGLDCAILGTANLPAGLRARLANCLHTHELIRLSVGGETIAQTAPPELSFDGAIVVLPPAAFLQPTAAGEGALWEAVRTGVGRARHVADLFCGVGPFALRLAQTAKVTAFDADRPAVEALRQAARRTPKLKPVAAEVRDLFREPLSARELAAFDAVVLDPPRQGAEAQSRGLARSAVPAVVYVSCDPSTFARDAAILLAGGYRLTGVQPIDQFKWTPHLECVGLFARGP